MSEPVPHKTHNILEIIGTHIATIVFITIRKKALDLSMSASGRSLTQSYTDVCMLYSTQIQSSRYLNEILEQIHVRYRDQYPGTTMTQMIDDIAKIFVPPAYTSDLNESHKGGIITAVMRNTTQQFIAWILEPRQLAQVIDKHQDPDLRTRVQDKALELLKEQRGVFYKKFAVQSTAGAGSNVELFLRAELKQRTDRIADLEKKMSHLINEYKILKEKHVRTESELDSVKGIARTLNSQVQKLKQMAVTGAVTGGAAPAPAPAQPAPVPAQLLTMAPVRLYAEQSDDAKEAAAAVARRQRERKMAREQSPAATPAPAPAPVQESIPAPVQAAAITAEHLESKPSPATDAAFDAAVASVDSEDTIFDM